MWHRIKSKFFGTKFIILDTEGVLPGQNRQHVLLEPEAYIHWFSHQQKRYNFQSTKSCTVGYIRADFIRKSKLSSNPVVTIATNFSVLGYSSTELENRFHDRKLKLKNDWSLIEYRSFRRKHFYY